MATAEVTRMYSLFPVETVNKQNGGCRVTRNLSVKLNNSYFRKYSSASKTDGIFVFRRPNYIRKSCFSE